MRIALVLVLSLLAAGCVVPAGLRNDAAAVPKLGEVAVPSGATLEAIENGARLVWSKVDLPFDENITIPQGATVVRALTKVGDAEAVSVALRNAETGRRRCQTPAVESWNEAILGGNACVGLAVVDRLPATWRVSASSLAVPTADLVAVEILSTPLEGPAAKLDLSQLSMPSYEMLDTEVVKVKAHDGALLHVELTRPDAGGRVPAVIVSTPYNDATRKAGLRPSDDVIRDWGARGYAIVVADVRGYGESGGCVEVWGPNEQKDQATLVEWVAAQEWSDGNVAFYGQSYVGTTPVEAAVQAPDALKAIIAVAPVINAYDDWHFGGVGNGEDLLSPVGYQQIGLDTSATDPVELATNSANGACDPTLSARANDPRAVYDAFYAERNFSARAADVKAAVLYTQGFEDSNVKSAMITNWFNALTAPKLGLFGHWVHQHPPRADQELLFLAWLDQYVKGKPIGADKLAPVSIVTGAGTLREAETWPPVDAADERLYLDLGAKTFSREPVDGFATLTFDSLAPLLPVQAPIPKTRLLAFEGALDEDVQLAGAARVEVNARVEYGENGYVAAFLYDGDRLVTWGMFNLAHRFGHDRYESLKPGEAIRFDIPLLPTEHVFRAGTEMRLEMRGAQPLDWAAVRPSQPTEIGLRGGEGGVALVLPSVPVETTPMPASLDWTLR